MDEDSGRKALGTNIAITTAPTPRVRLCCLARTQTSRTSFRVFAAPGIAAFVRAGLTPYQAIRAGTIDAARFLRRNDEFGTVAVGRRADLILLETNPLDDVANLAKARRHPAEWLVAELRGDSAATHPPFTLGHNIRSAYTASQENPHIALEKGKIFD